MALPSDLRNAVIAAVKSVTCSVSNPVADTPAAISPNERFTFSVTANNNAANAIRLVNVRYHLKITPGSVGEFRAPNADLSPLLRPRAVDDVNSDPLDFNEPRTSMYLFPTGEKSALGVGESDTITDLRGKALALGSASICCHIHGDPDLDYLFPKGTEGPDGCRSVNIV